MSNIPLKGNEPESVNTVYMYIQLYLALGAVIDTTLTRLDKWHG